MVGFNRKIQRRFKANFIESLKNQSDNQNFQQKEDCFIITISYQQHKMKNIKIIFKKK